VVGVWLGGLPGHLVVVQWHGSRWYAWVAVAIFLRQRLLVSLIFRWELGRLFSFPKFPGLDCYSSYEVSGSLGWPWDVFVFVVRT
jgi:hypothetical protein